MAGPLPRTIASGRHLRLVEIDGWEFVQRASGPPVIAIAALTDDGLVLFVEQFRPPVNACVIELPAGIAGDEEAGESLEQAARRELLEETGYEADRLRQIGYGVTSAGLTDEAVTFFLAQQLRKTAAGGGTGGEKIVNHEVPLDEVDAWLDARQREGLVLDARLLTGIYLLKKALGAG